MGDAVCGLRRWFVAGVLMAFSGVGGGVCAESSGLDYAVSGVPDSGQFVLRGEQGSGFLPGHYS